MTTMKVAALAIFMAGALSVKAANNRNNANVTNPVQTEVVSKAGAEALKANSISIMAQSEVPTVHNEKLDETIKKFVFGEEDKNNVEGLLGKIYSLKGTFLGTAYIQHELNTRALLTFVTGNTQLLREKNVAPEFADRIDRHGEEFYKTVKPNAQKVMDWANSKYTQYFVSNLNFDHKPTAEEVLNRLDEIIENQAELSDEEKNTILGISRLYRTNDLKSKKDTQSLSNLIAEKVNLYDTYMFLRELECEGLFDDGYFRFGGKSIGKYFLEWIYKVSPDEYNDN